MKRPLWIGLGASLMLTAIAASMGDPAHWERAVISAVERPNERPRERLGQADIGAPSAARASIGSTEQALPARPAVQLSDVDPFGLYRRPEPTPKPLVVQPQVVAVAPPVPPPVQPPPFGYQVFGRLTGPDGSNVVYLSQQERLSAISKGLDLENGFRVESITDAEVVVRHQPTGQELRLGIPTQSN
jgi:hypothetical protein